MIHNLQNDFIWGLGHVSVTFEKCRCLKSKFASQVQKYTSLEILSVVVGKMNSNVDHNFHTLPENTKCNRNDVDEDLVITTSSAAEHLMRIAGTHGSICDKPLTLNEIKHTRCSSEFKILCSACSFSSTWISSPELPDGWDLVNIRITHAYLSSGLLPSQLERF